jgi:hypothetical protein
MMRREEKVERLTMKHCAMVLWWGEWSMPGRALSRAEHGTATYATSQSSATTTEIFYASRPTTAILDMC